MNVSTLTAEIKSLNAEMTVATTKKQHDYAYLLSTCTEVGLVHGMSTLKSQYISTIDGILPQISTKKKELATLKK